LSLQLTKHAGSFIPLFDLKELIVLIKLIALDLDGTLIAPDQTVSKRNREAIKKCIDMGIMVSIHTGRCAASTKEIIKDLDLKGFHASSSGATLINENLELCYTKRMPPGVVRKVFLACRELEIPFISQTSDTLIAHEMLYKNLNYVVENDAVYKYIPDMTIDEVVQNTLQITLFISVDDPRNSYFKDRFGEALKFRRAGKLFVNIIDNSAGKLTGLKKVMELAGLNKEEVMAMGDTEVDLGIINFAGTGVAMENSPEAVKIAADFVSTECKEDGVAYAIKRFILDPARNE
jgi:Cof subfamily protein (haloacid dehalogenase superfamily)